MSRRRVEVALGLAVLAVTAISLPFAAGGATVVSSSEATPAAVDERQPPAAETPRRDGTDDLVCPRPTESVTAVPEPRIVELYPNPTTRGNVGEFLVVETPPETSLENWTITDGHTTAHLPSETVSGRVALSTAPEETRELTDDRVVELEGTLRLAVDGDELELRNGSKTVDAVSYDRAPTAERWHRQRDATERNRTTDGAGRGSWWPRDATCLPVSTADVDDATAFVLPDSPEVPRKAIRDADERLLLAGYTFTDDEIAAELVGAADRGVEVAVLLESGPVGGTPRATESVLETLEDGGVDVRVIGGEGARYRYHHPKYAVADDAVVVTTENWKPSGVGGESSRGWGVHVENAELAADLAAVFRADFEGWDTESGAAFRDGTSFVEDDPAPPRDFRTSHDPATVPVDSVELLLAPENAESRLRELLEGADDEILIKQASIDADVSLLEASVDAARRGVDVRILLDSTWYVEDENEALAADLERTVAAEELPLEVRLVDETDDFEKIHAKGVVIDRETAVVGSANWNENSLQHNREVLLALHSSEAASYYADVFESDWEGETWSLPIELSVTVISVLVCAALVGRRYVRFGAE
ncbi:MULTISPECIES: phospholipase D-like domain-containing protein [Natrialbaceae]|uniref:phospholipase D-like domain-containing protein n=1 Tax=Natrialbaceae TaxID=1644061 RepID=UPI00207D415F|nr:phospholipase D-like domain-containing protein [Natronococcus sp. CG52]